MTPQNMTGRLSSMTFIVVEEDKRQKHNTQATPQDKKTQHGHHHGYTVMVIVIDMIMVIVIVMKMLMSNG